MSRRAPIVLAASLACLAVAAPMAQAGHGAKWTRITATDEGIIEQVSQVRTADGVLHVIWRRRVSASSEDLIHTAISASGKTLLVTPVVTGWASLNNPKIVLTPSGALLTFWGGRRTLNETEPNNNLNFASSSDGGIGWTLYPGNLAGGENGNAAFSNPMGAAVARDGTPFEAFGGYVHRGINPADPTFSYQDLIGGQCCAYNADLAVDPAGGLMVDAWYSNANPPHNGVFVAVVNQATGAPLSPALQMPGSVTRYQGTPSTVQMDSRTPIVGRPGGGIYLAYPAGYPTTTKVILWRVGAPKSVVLASGSSTKSNATIAAAPDGRLWVAWTQIVGGRNRVFARRSNKAATSWGAPISIGAPPPGTSVRQSVYKLNADAQLRTLDVLGLFSVSLGAANTSTWHAQILPGLTLKAKPKSLKPKRKVKVTFSVADAGVPLKGVKVKAGKRKGKTNAKGKVTLKLGPFKPGKKVKATASKSGYTPVTLKLKIKRR